jgi:hypothetical protein
MGSEAPPTIETARKQLPRIFQAPFQLPLKKETLIGLAIGVIALKLLFVSFEVERYHRALPAALETAGFITSGNDTSYLAAFMPIRSEPCGGFVFHLSAATLKTIETRGLDFFKDARQGRGIGEGDPRAASEFSYQPWQATPLPDDFTRNGSWLGLHCMGWMFSPLGRDIFAAAQEPGSYFTIAPSKLLLVLPRRGLVVLTYNY